MIEYEVAILSYNVIQTGKGLYFKNNKVYHSNGLIFATVQLFTRKEVKKPFIAAVSVSKNSNGSKKMNRLFINRTYDKIKNLFNPKEIHCFSDQSKANPKLIQQKNVNFDVFHVIDGILKAMNNIIIINFKNVNINVNDIMTSLLDNEMGECGNLLHNIFFEKNPIEAFQEAMEKNLIERCFEYLEIIRRRFTPFKYIQLYYFFDFLKSFKILLNIFQKPLSNENFDKLKTIKLDLQNSLPSFQKLKSLIDFLDFLVTFHERYKYKISPFYLSILILYYLHGILRANGSKKMKSLSFSINFLLDIARNGFEGVGFSVYGCGRFSLAQCPYAENIFLSLPIFTEFIYFDHPNILPQIEDIAIINAMRKKYNITDEMVIRLHILIRKIVQLKRSIKMNFIRNDINNNLYLINELLATL